MRQISGNAGCVDDIVEGELVNEGAQLQEQRKGLEQAALALVISNSMQRGGKQTCPMPPEAPATTTLRSEPHVSHIHGDWGCQSVPALTILTRVELVTWGKRG